MKGDIILTYNDSFISRIISFVTKSKYSHIAMCFDDVDYIIAESWFEGVRITKLSGKENKYIRLRYNNLTEKQKEDLIGFIYDKIDYKYDYKLFIGIGLNKLFGLNTKYDNPNKYICLELILEAYRSIGIILMDNTKDNSPGDLMYCKKLTLV